MGKVAREAREKDRGGGGVEEEKCFFRNQESFPLFHGRYPPPADATTPPGRVAVERLGASRAQVHKGGSGMQRGRRLGTNSGQLRNSPNRIGDNTALRCHLRTRFSQPQPRVEYPTSPHAKPPTRPTTPRCHTPTQPPHASAARRRAAYTPHALNCLSAHAPHGPKCPNAYGPKRR